MFESKGSSTEQNFENDMTALESQRIEDSSRSNDYSHIILNASSCCDQSIVSCSGSVSSRVRRKRKDRQAKHGIRERKKSTNQESFKDHG